MKNKMQFSNRKSEMANVDLLANSEFNELIFVSTSTEDLKKLSTEEGKAFLSNANHNISLTAKGGGNNMENQKIEALFASWLNTGHEASSVSSLPKRTEFIENLGNGKAETRF